MNTINPIPTIISKSDTINRFLISDAEATLKEACVHLTHKLPVASALLEKSHISNIGLISRKYKQNPTLFLAMLNGKMKYYLKGFTSEPIAFFDKKEHPKLTLDELKSLTDKKTLIGYVMNLFDTALNKNLITKLSLKKTKNFVIQDAFNIKNKRLTKKIVRGKDLKSERLLKALEISENNKMTIFIDSKP